jgi:hypothetical protein
MTKWITVLILICLAGGATAQEYTMTQREFMEGTASPESTEFSEFVDEYWASHAGSDSVVEPNNTRNVVIWMANFPLDITASSFGGTAISLEVVEVSGAKDSFGIDKSWIYTAPLQPATYYAVAGSETDLSELDSSEQNKIFLQQGVLGSFSQSPLLDVTSTEPSDQNSLFLQQEILRNFQV